MTAPLHVIVFQIPGHPRSRAVCAAMMEGIRSAGDRPVLRSALSYVRPEGDVAVFYGLAGRMAHALRDYPAKGKTALYVDLGYWGRKDGGRFAGYHKISVNGRHPTGYFQARAHPDDRLRVFRVQPKAWTRDGGPVMIAGMGPKGARAEGFQPLGWEAQAVREIRKVSDRPILYRPKPNWLNPPALPGATMVYPTTDMGEALRGVHAVVTHHSNFAMEAITAGVPAYVVEGIAEPMASGGLDLIETPLRPAGREQWLADAAYTQWSIAEIHEGLPWLHLRSEGLL